ncbi:MAG: hydroxyphenylacetyl-CoA thioesterase PaaI [Egibacteraceae bacterium]
MRTVDEVVRALYERDRCAQAHGITIEEARPGYARLRMEVRRDMLNGHDICHGGITFLLADTAFAYACNAGKPVTVASAASVTFPSPAREGDILTAACREVHQRGRTGTYDALVTTADGDTVALFRGSSVRTGASSGPSLPPPARGGT